MAATSHWYQRWYAHALVALLQVVGWIVPRLHPRLWWAMAWVLGRVFWYCVPRYRRIALSNLCDGEGLDRAAAVRRGKASFTSNAMVLFESLAMDRLVARRGIQVEDGVTPEAHAILEQLRKGEIPLVVGLSGHTGVWEFLGADTARLARPAPTLVSARLPKNPLIGDYLRRLRSGFGLTLIDKHDYLRQVMRRVRNKEPSFCVFLCDQHFRDGMKVSFLGRKACTVGVPATLMLRYKAPAVVGGSVRLGPGRYRLELRALRVEPFLDRPIKEATRALTAAVNNEIGKQIERAPEQWTWGHRRWRECCTWPEPAAAQAQVAATSTRTPEESH